jgi:hypothetical protein
VTIPRLVTPRLRLIPELPFYSGLQGGCPVVGIMGAWTRIDDRTSGTRSPKPRANVAWVRARQTALSGWALLGQTLRQGSTRGGRPSPRKRGPDRRESQGADRVGGREVLHLPPHSPDLDPVEEAFPKIGALLRKAAARTRGSPIDALGDDLSGKSPRRPGLLRALWLPSLGPTTTKCAVE